MVATILRIHTVYYKMLPKIYEEQIPRFKRDVKTVIVKYMYAGHARQVQQDYPNVWHKGPVDFNYSLSQNNFSSICSSTNFMKRVYCFYMTVYQLAPKLHNVHNS